MFLAFIGVFAILFWVVPKSDFSPKEKRYLQTFPEVSATTLTDGSFESKFEDYINDHMVMRDAFMGINSYSNLIVLNNGSDGVYKCKNGYLINKPATNERLDLNLSVVSDFQQKTGHQPPRFREACQRKLQAKVNKTYLAKNRQYLLVGKNTKCDVTLYI